MIDISKIEDIKELNVISDKLISAGLPTAEQFAKLKEAGVEVVINVIPPLSSEPQPDLAAIFNSGLTYFNIPYNLGNPIVCMEAFIAVMDLVQDKNVLVHCAVNWRASFMLDAYNQIKTGEYDSKYVASVVNYQTIMKDYPLSVNFFNLVNEHYKINIIH